MVARLTIRSERAEEVSISRGDGKGKGNLPCSLPKKTERGTDGGEKEARREVPHLGRGKEGPARQRGEGGAERKKRG